jgi:hypothetical protein
MSVLKQWQFGPLAVVALLVISVFSAGGAAVATASASKFLSLTQLPPKLPTNSSGTSSFPALVVSITDSQGNALVAANGTMVYLSSSQAAVLSVQPSVTISAGAQYAIASVSATATPGNSTVTAVSPGFESASAVFQTYIARGYPTQLSLYPLPASFTAGQASAASYAVVVLDAAGLPARTIASTPVSLTSSNTSLVQVTSTQIPANKTVAYGGLGTSGGPGAVSITASAQGLVSSTALVTIVPLAGRAVQLSLSAPSNLPADGGSYVALTVSLLDAASRPAAARSVVQVLLTSSRTDLASVQQKVSVSPGQQFVTVPLSTSPASGLSLITASALNFTSSTIQVGTVSIPPTQLRVYLADGRALVSSAANALNFVVQLQDSQGVPAQARTSANVILSFSNRSLSRSPMTLTIPKGADLVYASVPLSEGTAGTFTAISNGLKSASAQFSAYVLPVTRDLGVSSPSIRSNQTATLYFSISYQGTPLSGAVVSWIASGGSVSPSPTKTDGSGSTSAVFTPSSPGVFTVTAVARDPVIGTLNATTSIIVTAPSVKAPVSLVSQILSYIYYIVAAAAAAVIVVVFLWRRRRGKVEDEDSFEIGESADESSG